MRNNPFLLLLALKSLSGANMVPNNLQLSPEHKDSDLKHRPWWRRRISTLPMQAGPLASGRGFPNNRTKNKNKKNPKRANHIQLVQVVGLMAKNTQNLHTPYPWHCRARHRVSWREVRMNSSNVTCISVWKHTDCIEASLSKQQIKKQGSQSALKTWCTHNKNPSRQR